MALVQYVSVTKAAKISGISVTKIYRFIHAGELKVYPQNGTLEIDIQDFLRKRASMKDSELLEPTFMNFIAEVKKQPLN